MRFVCWQHSNDFTSLHYLILLAEVHIQDLRIALRPFDAMQGDSGGDGLLRCRIL